VYQNFLKISQIFVFDRVIFNITGDPKSYFRILILEISFGKHIPKT